MMYITINFLKKTVLLGLIFSLLFGGSAFVNSQYGITPTTTDFDPSYIIPDEYVIDSPSLSAKDIEEFLKQRGSGLYNRTFYTPDGWLKASEIIARASITYNISAQFMLVKLQKEQSLVESKNPTQKQLDWATGYGVCDNCSLNDSSIQEFKGFYQQVVYGAKQMRRYIDNPERYNIKAGATVTIDGRTFTIGNRITAALYNYTPHIHGNQNLWKIWQRYWFRPFTDGMVVVTYLNNDPTFSTYWLIRDGKRKKFSSKGVYMSYSSSMIGRTPQTVPLAELEKYPIGDEIKYPEYSLLRGPGGAVYLIRDGKKSAFENSEVLRQAGFNPEEIEDVSQDDLDTIVLGKMITGKDLYPTGIVSKEIETGTMYYVEQDTKYLIPNKEILDILYPGRNLVRLNKKQLAKFSAGPIKFYPAGTVVKSNSSKNKSFYLVSEKGLQPFASNVDFVQLGYRNEDLVTVDQKILDKIKVLNSIKVGSDTEIPLDDIK